MIHRLSGFDNSGGLALPRRLAIDAILASIVPAARGNRLAGFSRGRRRGGEARQHGIVGTPEPASFLLAGVRPVIPGVGPLVCRGVKTENYASH